MKTKHVNLLPFLFLFLAISCETSIKKESSIQDEVFESIENVQVELSKLELDQREYLEEHEKEWKSLKPNYNENKIVRKIEDMIGYWVGDFENADESGEKWEKNISVGDGIFWNRTNKINISINEINDGKVTGHSVVAGNHRPFEGTVKVENDTYYFEVKEPGDDKYDGKFSFSITLDDKYLKGTWKAYKKIEIPKREYQLEKKFYTYNPNQMLKYGTIFGDWTKKKTVKREFGEDTSEEEKEYFGEDYETFAAASDAIYEINASNTLLKKEDVENLYKGDLMIIRNTIYARHGYSFKNRALRRFFDDQDWYIPLHNNIKGDFTSIELKNIELLLKYEKNADEYYDSFGR